MIAAAFDHLPMFRPRGVFDPLRPVRGASVRSHFDSEHYAKVKAAKDAEREAEGMDDLLAAVGTRTWR